MREYSIFVENYYFSLIFIGLCVFLLATEGCKRMKLWSIIDDVMRVEIASTFVASYICLHRKYNDAPKTVANIAITFPQHAFKTIKLVII